MASGTMVLDDVSAGWQTPARPRPPAAEQSSHILADSRAMRSVMELIDRAALHDTPVLLVGESGTGKELLARALHNRGPRAAGPFVAVNCSAIRERTESCHKRPLPSFKTAVLTAGICSPQRMAEMSPNDS